MGFTMGERKKIRAEYAKRYRKAKKTEKTKILDEYLWKFFRYICGERLVPLLRANIEVISRKRRFKMTGEVKRKLITISRSTVERLLTKERKKHKLKNKSTTKKGTLLKNQIPVRVF